MSDDAPVLRVATWNIHRCIGADRRRDARRIAQGILALDADLVALQEVEIPTQAAALSSAFELLRELACHGYQVLPGLGCLNHNLLIFIKHFESHRDVFTLKLTPKEENNNLINMLY